MTASATNWPNAAVFTVLFLLAMPALGLLAHGVRRVLSWLRGAPESVKYRPRLDTLRDGEPFHSMDELDVTVVAPESAGDAGGDEPPGAA